MQDALASSPLEFRMGVNLGDIVDDGVDIHGEGVNIAARIEGLAKPGGICVSNSAYPNLTVKNFKNAMVFSPQVLNRIGAQLAELGLPEE